MDTKEDTTAGASKSTAPPPRRTGKGCMRGKGGPENSLCPYHGVRQRTWGKWVAEIREPDHGERVWLGTFATSIEAARAYDDASLRMYGASANLNLGEDTPAAASGEGCEIAAGGGDWYLPDYEQEEACGLWNIPPAPTLLDGMDPERDALGKP